MTMCNYNNNLIIVSHILVVPTTQEPVPGWLDNVYGPIGLFIGGGKGILRVACLNKTVNEDAVPVDIVIKIIIVVTWKIGLTTYDHKYICIFTYIRL